MKRLNPHTAQQRREAYYELRRQGWSIYDAAAEVGVHDINTAKRYERWFQAIERGEITVNANHSR